MLSLRLPSLSSVISCAASLNISHRLTLCSAAVFLAWRPSSLYPTLALSWILFSPCLSRLDSTGISLAESASEMSMRDSTSRATARSASRRSKDDDVAEPTLLRGLGLDAPFPPVGFLPAKPKEEDRLTTSMDCLLLFGLLSLAFARACASASIICSRALFDSASIWLWLWLSTSANERVTSSSSLDSTDVRCGACAGFFSGTGKRSSSLACPADAGMEGRRSDAVITFGLAASTSRERLDDSAPVSVCDGVESGESVGDPADLEPQERVPRQLPTHAPALHCGQGVAVLLVLLLVRVVGSAVGQATRAAVEAPSLRAHLRRANVRRSARRRLFEGSRPFGCLFCRLYG